MSARHPAGAQLEEVQRLAGGEVYAQDEWLAVERPLRIVVQWMPLLTTMRTPGDERELVTGYLIHEGVIREAAQLTSFSLSAGDRLDTARVELAGHFDEAALAGLRRASVSVSSCGVCGRDEEALFTPKPPRPPSALRVPLDALDGMLAAMRARQRLFDLTGGLHAAGIFANTDEPLCVFEDIGRHNAIDKAVGWLAQEGRLGEPLALVSSGRASFEVLQKAAMAGLGTIISASAASSMAVEVARAFGIRLVGFVRPGRAVVYSPGAG